MAKNFYKQKNIFIYGKHPFYSAIINNNRIIDKVIIEKKNLDELEKFIQENSLTIKDKIQIVNKEYFNKILPKDSIHQGYVLKCLPLDFLDLHSFLDSIEDKKNQTILILDQATDTRNIGAIIRNAVAFNADAILFPSYNSFKENGSMVKASAGGIEKIPLIEVNNLVNAINILKQQGYWIIGLDSHTESYLHTIDSFEKTALILGSEGKGMRKLTAKSCDFLAKIPMNSNNMESLNISNAAAIALYELYKKNI